MGASGTAPAFSAAYGSEIIPRRWIPGLFGVFVFLGAVIAGGKVVKTISGDLVPAELFAANVANAAGLICVVTATILLLVSVTRGIPTSLVQMNTAAIIGVGAVKLGWRGILRRKSLWRVFGVWFAAPCISMVLAYFFCYIVGV